jgi:hypothetical protein
MGEHGPRTCRMWDQDPYLLNFVVKNVDVNPNAAYVYVSDGTEQ